MLLSARFQLLARYQTTPRPSVVPLLCVGSPSAVGRFVVPAWVNTVNRVFRCGPVAHVGKERLEGLTPTVTDTHATSAVIVKLIVSRVMAAVFHHRPDANQALVGLRHAVSGDSRLQSFFPEASAALAASAFQHGGHRDGRASTDASAEPLGLRSVSSWYSVFSGQSAEYATSQILKRRIGVPFGWRHMRTL